MSYIINQDIIDRVGNDAAVQLTADSGAVVDTDVLDEVRLSSEGEADGYLNRRYDVPVDLVAHPELAATLRGVVLDIAVYRLFSRRPPVSEHYEKARANAIEWLMRVAKGEIVLPAETTPVSTESDNPKAVYGSQDQNLSTGRSSL